MTSLPRKLTLLNWNELVQANRWFRCSVVLDALDRICKVWGTLLKINFVKHEKPNKTIAFVFSA